MELSCNYYGHTWERNSEEDIRYGSSKYYCVICGETTDKEF